MSIIMCTQIDLCLRWKVLEIPTLFFRTYAPLWLRGIV